MSTSQPLLSPEERLALEQKARYERITRNLAIGGLIACPVIALLPPRKLDLYTLSLGIGFYLSADHLVQSYNGRPLFQQISFKSPIRELPTEKAQENARILREREELERSRREGREPFGKSTSNEGVLEKLWMGDEKEGWREKRIEEDKKALEEGKTYTGMILDQIWEVCNWDRKGADGQRKTQDGKDGTKKS